MIAQELNSIVSELPDSLKSIVTESIQDKEFDIFKFDRLLGESDPDYDNFNGVYKSREVSTKDYVIMKYGKQAANKIQTIINFSITKR